MTDAPETLLVFTNFPDHDSAVTLARTLVERRLAACVNVLGGATSIYRWQQSVETAHEVPVLIKTRRPLYAEVEAAIREMHSYELPEIIAVPITHGLPRYLDWITTEATP